MIRAVLFDFDETLVNSLETFWHVFNRGAARVGLPPESRGAVAGGLSRGIELKRLVSEIYPDADAATVEAGLKEMRQQFPEVTPDYPVTLKPEVPEVLAGIKARGLRMGLATARTYSEEAMREELEGYGIANYFDCIATGRDLPRKPAPDVILSCLYKLALAPEEVILVGDAETDILAGAAAGVSVVLLSDGYHDREKHPPDHSCHLIQSLPEIFDYLERRDNC